MTASPFFVRPYRISLKRCSALLRAKTTGSSKRFTIALTLWKRGYQSAFHKAHVSYAIRPLLYIHNLLHSSSEELDLLPWIFSYAKSSASSSIGCIKNSKIEQSSPGYLGFSSSLRHLSSLSLGSDGCFESS